MVYLQSSSSFLGTVYLLHNARNLLFNVPFDPVPLSHYTKRGRLLCNWSPTNYAPSVTQTYGQRYDTTACSVGHRTITMIIKRIMDRINLTGNKFV